MIIGNGVTDWKMDHEPGYLQMGLYYALYNQDLAKELQASNCNLENYHINSTLSKTCNNLYNEFKNLTQCINIYDIYRKPKTCALTKTQLL